ncbi:MAG: OmpA family protein [Silicimonas sp.]|nr:OmpA family protein [Silicimonas sp.]
MIRAVLILMLLAAPASALDLSVPNATLAATEVTPAGSVRLPTEPWTQGKITKITEGSIRRQVFRLPQPDLTTLQLIQPLRAKLQEDGYREVFTCADASCGGFDFRFQLDLLPAPDMYVDLGDYRYLLMTKPSAAPHSLAFVASRSATAGFVHVTEVFDASFPKPETTSAPNPPSDALNAEGVVETLTATGHAVLDDLDFITGSADLGPGPYASLQAISLWLETNPSALVVFVGHTDSVGSLDANIDLSRRRALSVMDRLVSQFGTNASQLEAAGAGYLSPVATNLTEQGRAANRRVEVVLLSIN